MSYCRFSTDDFRCDVYVYHDVSGVWTTHVAASRFVFDRPLPDPVDDDDIEGDIARDKQVEDLLAELQHEPLPEPHAGQQYSDPTPGACADRLELLRAAGFTVPQSAIDRLREEQAERPGE